MTLALVKFLACVVILGIGGLAALVEMTAPRTRPIGAGCLPPRLTQADVDRCRREAYEEMGLDPPPETTAYGAALRTARSDHTHGITASFQARPIDNKPLDYFRVEQACITDPATGERRAVIYWTGPSGERHAYSEALLSPALWIQMGHMVGLSR